MTYKGADIWPSGFERIPREEPWVSSPIDESARAYDEVQHHAWYQNLHPTLDSLAAVARAGDIVVDYSAGTGIFTEEFLRRNPDRRIGLMLVDASPKFLRLALEKLGTDHRTAYRRLRYLKDEQRLQQLDEVLPESLRNGGFDGLCSTNAVHLYDDLRAALGAWAKVVRPGGYVLLQSGNIDNPHAPANSWFIDQTIERVQSTARGLVICDPAYAAFRDGLDDDERTKAYDSLRHKYFLPIRPLSFYLECLRSADFEIEAVDVQPIEALVTEWSDFLCAYHEGVLGWAGGCSRVDGRDPSDDLIALRKRLLRESMAKLFDGAASFQACWTHVRCRKA